MLALLVDWGYRPDGVPVRLFGAWTTLPAGPGDARREDRRDHRCRSPSGARRDGTLQIEGHEAFTVPSSAPADIQRATQQIADSLEATVGAAPEQWYSFKPIWPDTRRGGRRARGRAAPC